MSNFAILLAAGSGQRMESHNLAKCFIEVKGKELYTYSLDTFLNIKEIQCVYLVVPIEYEDTLKIRYKDNDRIKVLHGGKTRQESVYFALKMLENEASKDDIVLIHDAARPLVSEKIIFDNIKTCQTYGACLTAIKSIDTIVHTHDFEFVSDIPKRDIVFSEQTPASFKFDLILKAHQDALNYNLFDSSDDCILVMKENEKIHLVAGERNNFKITNEIDLALFKLIIENKDNLN